MKDRDRWKPAAVEAATVLVAAMTTPMWPAAKRRIVLLLGAEDRFREGQVSLRLEESRNWVTAEPRDQFLRGRVVERWAEELAVFADGYTGMWMRSFTDTFDYLLRAVPEPHKEA